MSLMRLWPGKIEAVFFVLFAALALAGCTVGPNYVRPPAATPEAFKEMERLEEGRAGGPPAAGQVVGDIQRSRVERAGRAGQHLEPERGHWQRHSSARRGPLSRSPGPPISRPPRSGLLSSRSFQANPLAPSVPVSLFTLPVDVTWEPDLWGRVRRSVEASRAGAQASAADLQGVLPQQRRRNWPQNYFQLRGLDAQSRILNETVEAYRKSLRADAKQVSIRRGIEGRCAPGRYAAQNHPGPGD